MAPKIAPWPRGCIRCLQYKDRDAFPIGKAQRQPERTCWPCKEQIAWDLKPAIDRAARCATWEENGVMVRRCRSCGEAKPIADFYLQRNGPNKVARLGTCKACVMARVLKWKREMAGTPRGKLRLEREAARERARRKRDPERQKEIARRYRERVKNDPAKRVQALEDARMRRRLYLERIGKPVAYSVPTAARQADKLPKVPPGPLVSLIEEVDARSDEGMGATCRRLGIHERQYRSWKRGEYEAVQYDTADRILTAAGRGWWEVFPEDEFPEVAERLAA